MRTRVLLSVLGIVSSAALAARADTIVINGQLNEASWATATTTHVSYDPSSLVGNFGQPGAPVGTTTNAASYDVKVFDDGTNYYVGLSATPDSVDPGNFARVAGDFANLYFDTDPQNHNGSDVGFEVANKDYFNPNLGITFDASSYLKVAVDSADHTIELAIKNTFFTAGATGVTFPLATGDVTLRLSQSFGYSVVGGDLTGDRLGTASVVGTPLPSSAAGGLFLLGLAGAYRFARRRFAVAI